MGGSPLTNFKLVDEAHPPLVCMAILRGISGVDDTDGKRESCNDRRVCVCDEL